MRVWFDSEAEVILVGDEALEVEDVTEDFALARIDDLKPIAAVTANDFGEGIHVTVHSTDGFGTYLFHEVAVLRPTGGSAVLEFRHHHPNKYWEGRFGLATLLAAMRDQVEHHDGLKVTDIELEDDWKLLAVQVDFKPDESVQQAIERGAQALLAVHGEATVALSGFVWKPEYEHNERLFCTEVLSPLLRRMGFVAVHYTQGAREYGKDFTFSEPTRFGHLRHYGLQAKAGDVRGSVNGDIDEIIGQLDDAFKMPYIDISAAEERFISTFVVAISGRFTENAKAKIRHKIPPGLVGSVVFLDRERVLELVEQHWVKA